MATLMSSALPLSITLVASHALTADELGQVSLVLWFIALGSLLGASWAIWLLPQIALRRASTTDGVIEGLGLSFAGGGVTAGLGLLTGLPPQLILPSAFGGMTVGALRVLGAVFQARGRYLRLAVCNGIGLVVALASLALALATSTTSATLVIAYVAGLVTAAVIAYLTSGALQARRLSTDALPTALRNWSFTLLLALIDLFVWGRLELFFLHTFRTDQEVGQYAAAYAVVAAIGLPSAAMSAVALPTLAKAIQRHDARLVYSQMWLAVSLTFPPLLWAATLATQLLVGRAGSQLSPSPSVLAAILSIGVGPAACTVVASSALYASGLIGRLATVGTVGAVTNTALDLLFIPPFGMVGAAGVTAVVRLSVMSILFTVAGRELGVRRITAVMAAVAIAAGALGDLGLLLSYTGQLATGLLMLAAATIVVFVVAIRFAQELRRRQL